MLSAERGTTSHGEWSQQRILFAVREKGSTIAALSRQHGLKPQTLQSAFYKRYPRGHTIIASFLGRTRHELWPNWYGPNDELLPLGGANQRAA